MNEDKRGNHALCVKNKDTCYLDLLNSYSVNKFCFFFLFWIYKEQINKREKSYA